MADKRVLICLCARKDALAPEKYVTKFCDIPLYLYSVAAAHVIASWFEEIGGVDLCINTDDEALKSAMERFPEWTVLLRNPRLSEPSVPKEDVYRDCLVQMERQKRVRYDFLVDLDLMAPLRRTSDLIQMVGQFLSTSVDVLFSVVSSRSNPYYNMVQPDENGLARQIIANTNTNLTQAPDCYELNSSMYLFSRDFLIDEMTFDLWQGRVGLYEMPDIGFLNLAKQKQPELLEAIGFQLLGKEEYAAIAQQAKAFME